MAWKLSNDYVVDNDGNLDETEVKNAKDNGDLEELTDGSLYCRYTGECFWSDGTKRG